jgi:RNA-directed DNA polymerase
MGRNGSHLPFERYADEIIVHCRTEREANLVRVKIAARLKQCGLERHPERRKSSIARMPIGNRPTPTRSSNFLGYTFRPRKANGRKGRIFCRFSPAISKKAAQKIRDEIRGWKLPRCRGQSIEELARKINPKLRGWSNYYGSFTPSALRSIERHVGPSLVRWACRKYKKLRHHRSRAWTWLMEVIDRQPKLLALWEQQRSRFVT